MAYEANREVAQRENQMSQDERNMQNNENNLNNAAKVAKASGNPYAMAAGAAYEKINAATDGMLGRAGAKAMTQANKMTPGGNQVQNAFLYSHHQL